ncbi:MAG: hypothetical protein R3E31_02170 [Chloroflexota bacterium]
MLDLPQEETAETMLRQMAEAGLAERRPSFAIHNRPADEAQLLDYDSRLQNELAAIIQHGFAPLFLLVADLVRFAREHDVPVSTRGSVANSLVAYALGITTVDPIEHGLLFERFPQPGTRQFARTLTSIFAAAAR